MRQAAQTAGIALSALLCLIVAVVCAITRAVALRGGSVWGIMFGVAAYPAACVALVVLTPESWEELRWIGFGHGFVAVSVALGVAIVWALIRSGGSRVPSAARSAATTATTASRWRPVA
jgi:hypothetical protein